MSSTSNAGIGHGSKGLPQRSAMESKYPEKESENERKSNKLVPPKYSPSPKHEPNHNFGSPNPIKTIEEGQHLLDTGYRDGKQVYNITDEKKLVKFQPDHTPENGFHAYEVSTPRDIPTSIMKKLLDDGKITKSEYGKLRKGKKL